VVPIGDFAALLEGEDTPPVVLYADYNPAILRRLIIQPLCEGADLRVGESSCRTISVYSRYASSCTTNIIGRAERGTICSSAGIGSGAAVERRTRRVTSEAGALGFISPSIHRCQWDFMTH
jgi:hypothetical protein